MRLRVGAATNIGRVRKINEDAYAVQMRRGLAVVCDGMGGSAAGEVASQLAIETITKHLNGIQPAPDALPDTAQGFLLRTARLAEAIRQSNQAIYAQAQENNKQAGMGTTVVSAWVRDNIASLAHVGDSRAYLWHGDTFEPITRDHSLVEAQVHAGLMSRAESLKSKQQNILLRALGREPEVEVELNEVPVTPGDYLLLCSDGLTRMVPDATLARAIRTLREPQKICDYLIEAANRKGGPDNITVVVVEVLESWWRRLWRR